MNSCNQSKKVLLLFLFSGFFCSISYAQNFQSPCKTDSRTRQFDFWIGEWAIYKYGTDTLLGYNSISFLADSCALFENYKSTRGSYKGSSINNFNFANGKWQQTWVDNSGLTLFLQGNFSGNKMILSGTSKEQNGNSLLNRITWYKLDDGTLRQVWERRNPAVTNWTKVFDGLYKRR